ncbi:hypothetical protein JCM10207_005994 [Rhodosporidiobolus poonsookiae]
MGVHGLTSYIRKHTSLGTYLSLPQQRDAEPTPFIIDGMAFLFSVGLIDTLRGGNYTTLRASVRRHIEYWRACGLEPEFVWDGPFDSNKLPTVIQRSSQSLARSIAYMRAPDQARASYALRQSASRLPPLTHMAVAAELEALGVRCHAAQEEGDSPTAELAQRRNGFVVSNDSDYFIYPAQCRGYVPLSSIEYGPYNAARLEQVLPTDAPSLRLRVFHPAEVAHAFALPLSLLPTFAALIGNDLADYASELVLPRAGRKPLFPGQMEPQELRRIAGVLAATCAGMPTATLAELQDVVFAVLPHLLSRPSLDPLIVANLAASAHGYALRALEAPSPSFPLAPHPGDSPSSAHARALYRKAYTSSHLSSFLLHVLKHGVVMMQGSVENPDAASPMVVFGRPLRRWVYAILQDALGPFPHGAKVVEYVRSGVNLVPQEVDVPHLANLVAEQGADPALVLLAPPTTVAFLPASPTPAVLLPRAQRFSLFLLALSFPTSLAPTDPLYPHIPLLLALHHLTLHHAPKRRWSLAEQRAALVTSALLHLAPAALALPPLSTASLPPAPPRALIQRSVELVQTLVFVNLVAQALFLCAGQADALGPLAAEEGMRPPHEVFDGRAMHVFMGMREEQVARVVQGVGGEVAELVSRMEGVLAVAAAGR